MGFSSPFKPSAYLQEGYACNLFWVNNQNFNRWNLTLTALSKNVLIENQVFSDSVIFNLEAKNRIVIGENTVLKPNKNGSSECRLIITDADID